MEWMGCGRVELKQRSEVNKVNERMGGTNQPRAFLLFINLNSRNQYKTDSRNKILSSFLPLCFFLSSSDSCFNPKIGGRNEYSSQSVKPPLSSHAPKKVRRNLDPGSQSVNQSEYNYPASCRQPTPKVSLKRDRLSKLLLSRDACMHARGLDPPVSCALRHVVGRRGRLAFIGQLREVRAAGELHVTKDNSTSSLREGDR